VRIRTLAIVGLGGLLLVTGCSGSSSGGKTSIGSVTNPVRTPRPHTGSPSPTPTPSPTVTTTVTAPVGVTRCRSSQLSVSLGQGQGTAGSTYTPIVFTNTGSSRCELQGYPGVSFVDANGVQIGTPARETPSQRRTVKLASGASANAPLQQPDPGNFDPPTCQPTTADRLRVYPPGDKQALFIKDHVQVCTTKTGRTSVSVVIPGSGG
jgi:hypothetical protein